METLKKNGEVDREIEQMFGCVPEWVAMLPPEAKGPFWAMMRDLQLAETKIPNKYKELIGLAVAGATRCRYCVLFHTEAARLFGATDEEIREASMMAAHTMGASTFLNAMQPDFNKFRQETLSIVAYVRQQMNAVPQTATSQQAHV